MSTTIMRDSIVGDAWIQQTCASVPIQPIISPETGVATGDILTGPVRLAFVDLMSPAKKDDPTDPDKYGCAILFPPGVDFSHFYNVYNEIAGQKFPQYFDQASGQYLGLQSPFNDQGEKARFSGFTPGSTYMNVSTQYKPPLCDTQQNPIVDPNKVKSGVWAICALNAYSYDKKGKRGVAFGLQNVMIIGEDSSLGGGGTPNAQQFAGVNVTAPIVQPSVAQAVGNAPNGAPAPQAGIPGYTAPLGASPVAGAPIASAPPAATPAIYVAPATTSPTDDWMS